MYNKELIRASAIKKAIIGFVVLSAIIILYVIIDNVSHLGKIAVKIKYAPFEASVFIDGENYPKNNAINWFEPGPHHIMVVMNGFKALEENVEIDENTKQLYGSLELENSNNYELYQKYQSDYQEVEGLGGIESKKAAEDLTTKWPILRYLPYTKNNFAIGSMFDEQDDLIITIRAEATQIDNAINTIRSFKDVTISDYDIVIKDFQNILENQFVNNATSDPVAFLENGYQKISLPYQINTGQQVDDYYCTTISVGKYAGYIPVTYRVIIQKTELSWQLVSSPYPVLTKYNTPNLDSTILDLANQLDAPIAVQPDSAGDGH